MKTHEIKIEPCYFDAVASGDKTFEIRRNDRGYQKGDKVILNELSNSSILVTGRKIHATITYVTNYEQRENFVVFGIKVEEVT